MNFQASSNLMFRPLFKNLYLIFPLTWGTRTVKRNPLRLPVTLDLIWSLEKPLNSRFLQDKKKCHTAEALFKNVGLVWCISTRFSICSPPNLTRKLSSNSKYRRVIQAKSAKRAVWFRRDKLKNISHWSGQLKGNTITNLSWAVPEIFKGKITVVDVTLLSHDLKNYSTTSLERNCIEFDFQTDCNCYVALRPSFWVLKPKLVRNWGYQTYKTTQIQQEHKSGTKEAAADVEVEEKTKVALIAHLIIFLHSTFFNAEVHINCQLIYISKKLFAHKFGKCINFKWAISEHNGVFLLQTVWLWWIT